MKRTREAAAAGLGDIPNRALADGHRAAPGKLRGAGRLGVSDRFKIAIFCLTALPSAACLLLVESGAFDSPKLTLAALTALYLGLLGPLGALAARFCVLDELRCLNAFCSDIKSGRYGGRFDLGPEQDDEHDMLRLKRSLNWMAHHIETREAWLTARLRETDKRKRDFEELSRTDPLTGLFNRRFFDLVLTGLMDGPAGVRNAAFIAMIDCDRFKEVNDRYGHQAGDDALTLLGRVMRDCVREGADSLFRMGGDEFCALFTRLDDEAAYQACERIRCAFAGANGYGCSVSIGLAACGAFAGEPDPARRGQALIAVCDRALYRAKFLGGDRVVRAWDFE